MSTDDKKTLSRRTVFAAGGTVGALAAAAAALPLARRADPAPVVADTSESHTSGGYQETPHVLRYYQTTRV
jgi:hypothetical protein